MDSTKFLIDDGEFIRINAPYAEAYIPKEIIGDPEKSKSPIAYKIGEHFKTVGLFSMKFFESDESPRDKGILKSLVYPNSIITRPSAMDENVTLKLSADIPEDTYTILRYYQGDILMENSTRLSNTNCDDFMKILSLGKIPTGISYPDIYFAWMDNFASNGIHPGVPAIILQLVISENCRSPKDSSIQYRRTIDKSDRLMTGYKMYNMVDICSRSSVINALSFERFKQMLTYSLNMSKENAMPNPTPIEKVLSY